MSSRVAPFGNPRINGYLLLPEAYRSLSRPSSAPDAKAFPLRSFQLDLLVAKSAWLRFRFRENFARSLAPRFRRKLVFGERGDGRHGLLLRVVREFLVLFENYAGFTKIEIVCHPASFRMLFHNQFASSCFHMTPLCCLTCFCHIVQFSGADRKQSPFGKAHTVPFFSFSHFKRFTGLKNFRQISRSFSIRSSNKAFK